MSAILHINDNNLIIHQGDKVSRSQGYAWLNNDQVYFDLDQQNNAVAHCRLEPQQINSLYWQQCAQTAIASNDSGMRHAADLIWKHLSELKTQQSLDYVSLIVPSHYQANNLQLLLGVARSCGLKVDALVNKAAVALHSQLVTPGTYLHVDVQLHQTVCSEVIADNDSIKLGAIEVLHEVGLQAMQDALLKEIQQRFILSDRFDPLHYAETEQQLFDQLADLAAAILRDGKANVMVEYEGRQHVSSIDSKQWHAAVTPFVKQLVGAKVESEVSHRFYDFNGFEVVHFAADGNTSLSLDAGALSSSQLSLRRIPRSDLVDSSGQLIYRTELNRSESGKSEPGDIAEPQNDAAAAEPVSTAAEKAPVKNSTNGLSPEVDRPAKTSSSMTSSETSAMASSPVSAGPGAVTHLMQAGFAIPVSQAHITTSQNQLKLSQARNSNIAQMLNEQKIFIMSDAQRLQLQADDRLGSNLADGVITAIRVVQEAASGVD